MGTEIEKVEYTGGGLMRPVADVAQMGEVMRLYQALCTQLLDESDYQTMGGRRFRKRSGWRKLAVAFNVDAERVGEEDRTNLEGRIVLAKRVYRATAPNGRHMDGEGYCDVYERCCTPGCTKDVNRWGKPTDHVHCPAAAGEFCSGVSHWSHAEHDVRATAECVPLRAEILTRRGWCSYDDLTVGEEVLAYDVAGDRCRWTPLRRTVVYEDAQVVRMSNRQNWGVVCTPEHTWPMWMETQRVRTPQRRLVKTCDLGANNKLINAALADDGGRIVDPRDAAILGWLITDGRVTWDAFYPRAMIYQSKQPYVDEIRALLGPEATEGSELRPPQKMPSGQVSTLLRAYRWTLTTDALKSLMQRTGVYSPADLAPFVTHVQAEARQAMLDAMLHAHGSRHGVGGWVFSKSKRSVMDAFELLATLQGRALGREARKEKQIAVTLRVNRFTRPENLTIEPEFPEAVWCPTTDYGTWVMRLDGLVTLTGNTRAKNRAFADLFGQGEVSADEVIGEGEDVPADGQAPANGQANGNGRPAPNGGGRITDAQLKFLRKLMEERNLPDSEVAAMAGVGELTSITKAAASGFIEKVKAMPRRTEPVKVAAERIPDDVPAAAHPAGAAAGESDEDRERRLRWAGSPAS